MNLRLDGIAVRRWSLDDAQVTGTHQRELQRTGNGCCRERQCIDIRPHLTEFLFHRHSEFLFLINDQESEILELHRLPDEFMRTYQDIYLPLRQVLQNLLGLFRSTSSGKVIDPHRKVFQAFAEGLVVLESKDGGRYQYRHLFGVTSRLKGCTYSNLRLTKAYIPTYQAVHGTSLFHIPLHIIRSLQLVWCILIEE